MALRAGCGAGRAGESVLRGRVGKGVAVMSTPRVCRRDRARPGRRVPLVRPPRYAGDLQATGRSVSWDRTAFGGDVHASA